MPIFGNNRYTDAVNTVQFAPVGPPARPQTPSERLRRALTYETESSVADLTIKTTIDSFKVPSEIVVNKLTLLQELRDQGKFVEG